MKSRLVLPLAVALLALSAAPAFAHTHVRAISIAENAIFAAPPTNFTVAFTEPAAIANVTLASGSGEPAPLNYHAPSGFAASYQIPLPPLGPGAYTLAWRMIARDGHVMNNAVHFSVHAP